MRHITGAKLALIGATILGLLALSSGPAVACSILPPKMPPMLAPLPDEPEAAYRERQQLHFDGFNALQRQRTQDAERARQADAWTNAVKVAVVELVRVETGPPNQQTMMMGPSVRASVRPISWIKGRATLSRTQAQAPLTLAYLGYTSCGPYPDWPVFRGKTGDRFVMFFNADAPSQAAALTVYKPADIVVGDVTAALAAHVR